MATPAEKMATTASTKFVTKALRVAYPHFYEPVLDYNKTDYRYEGVVLIPKNDAATINQFLAAATASVDSQIARFKSKGGTAPFGGMSREKMLSQLELKDGDEWAAEKADGSRDWAKGHYKVTVRKATKTREGKELPKIGFVDRARNPMTREGGSGDYFKLSLDAFASRTGTGVFYTFYLQNVMHYGEGEPIGATRVDAANENWGEDDDNWL